MCLCLCSRSRYVSRSSRSCFRGVIGSRVFSRCVLGCKCNKKNIKRIKKIKRMKKILCMGFEFVIICCF